MLPLVNDAYRTLTPYVPGKPVSETERELGISGAIKLASNENPLGPSPKAVEAIRAALPRLHDYPDGGAFYFKRRLAEFLGVGAEQLILGNGTNEIIEMLVRTCVRPGETLLYGAHSFVIYKLCALSAGVTLREVPFKDRHIDLVAMARAADEHTKLVFLDNPNNPTGSYFSAPQLDAFLDALPPSVVVVLDEAYFEYRTAEDCPNGLDYLAHRPRLMVLRTFSKAYGLAGLRVGYGVGHPDLVDYLNRGRQPFNVNSLAQVGAMAALDDQEHVQRAVQLNREQMAWLRPRLEQRGLSVAPSQANFVLVDFGRPAKEVFEALLREGVIIRPMAGYGLPNCARVTVGTGEQNERLLAALDRVLG